MSALEDDEPMFKLVNDDRPEHCDWCGHVHVPGSAHPDVNQICSESCCTK